jgi:poly(3-hydroxybutyrate) depolymerase
VKSRRAWSMFAVALASAGGLLASAMVSRAQERGAAGTPTPATRPTSRPAGRGANQPIPPRGDPLAPADRQELEAGAERLGKEVAALREELKGKPELLKLLPDVQIYHNAIRYPLQYDEPINVGSARTAISEGLERAKQLRAGDVQWTGKDGPRGYVSAIDGSVQPYMLIVPTDYNPQQSKETKYRLDVFCHGRSERLMELNFLHGKEGAAPPAGPGKFVAWLYGRYCNANKFAGEIDCLEAIADIARRHPIDENRRLMIGFSMGGAAVWQFAVHYTDLWAAASPGAGFSESRDFLHLDRSGELATTPWYQKTLWHWYDCTDYAVNLFNLPTIAYAGEIDPQKQASDMMEKALAAEGLKLDRIIGPKTAHAYEKGARAELMRRLDEILAKGRNPLPEEVRFTTWTLRYNQMFWVTVDGLEHHWQRARVNAKRLPAENAVQVKTENVSRLTLDLAANDTGGQSGVEIDGQRIDGPRLPGKGTTRVSLEKLDGKWRIAAPGSGATAGLRKVHGLQGPIDDAFMEPFVIVRPTGKAVNEQVGAWTSKECDHAIDHWRKQFRGEAQVREDGQVSDEDIATKNLVLFGDPASNKVLAKIADRLPIKWSAEAVTVGSQTFPADRHVPALIYPNPLNPNHYIVLNSGVTFREFDYTNNARQIPKLPDWAVIDISSPVTPRAPGAVPIAGFFDEQWQLPKDGQASFGQQGQ